MKNKFYIIYPKGDRSKLEVTDIDQDELSDYALASRQSFHDEEDAKGYAWELSKKHNKQFSSNIPDYLD